VSKILNSNDSSNNTKKLTNWFYNSSNSNDLNTISNLNERFNDFPLNLLPEINQLATAELMFLFIILNIFIVKYITSLDYNKHIPNNNIGTMLKILMNRYIVLWSKSAKLLLIVSWIGLFICVIGSKIFLFKT
jgi:hypothetical protein